ncbi:MAG: GNAT family N-acetyltransferase [Sphingosinicella sp.]
MSGEVIVARLASGVAAFDPAHWNACAGADDPFVSHAFLAALEESGSVGAGTGWRPLPLAIDGPNSAPDAALPSYLKSHSLGEYVFDQGWADAWQGAGKAYYPKLQIAVPFTPVSGPRLLARRRELRPALIAAAERVVLDHGLSSAHATFIADQEAELFAQAGWLIRTDCQFRWCNRGYSDFDDFLASLSSRKRKMIRREREQAQRGIEILKLAGGDIGEREWDFFWTCYQDTGARKWGRPYLTRAFFSLIGARLGDRVLMFLAMRGGRPVAAALNLVGGDALYGRYWGTLESIPYLHFELCYYQAIEAAIARGLGRVEAGAQGGHKLARGHEPAITRSAHFIADAGFRAAVAKFLRSEGRALEQDVGALAGLTPFRKS